MTDQGSTENPGIAPRIRTARGRTHRSIEDPHVSVLYGIVTALAAEVAALRDRLDTHERLASKGVLPAGDAVEDYRPDEEADAERDAVRAAYIKRVYRAVTSERDRIRSKDRSAKEVVAEVNEADRQ